MIPNISKTIYFLIITILISLPLCAFSQNDQLISCGGFVLPSTIIQRNFGSKIDLSNIKLILLKDGIVKLETTPAPNGYYIIPIYDEGDYQIKIGGPEGWSFEPELTPIKIKNGKCNDGEDINFVLSGFRLSGRVVCDEKCELGKDELSNISIILNGKKSTTNEKGEYVFENVAPGDHILEVSHDSWDFKEKTMKINMPAQNYVLEKPFFLSGYSISGSILESSTTNEPIEGIKFILFSSSDTQINCTPPSKVVIDSLKSKNFGKPICETSSDTNGHFEFKSIPCGKYTLVPYYHDEESSNEYEILPEKLDIEVKSGSYVIDKPFIVTGFFVQGKVVDVLGNGIPNVSIEFSGSPRKYFTDQSGTYLIGQVSSGIFTITAHHDQYEFSQIKSIKLDSSKKNIPDIIAEKVKVCGKIYIPHPPNNVKIGGRKINVVGQNFEKVIKTNEQGEFCAIIPTSPTPKPYIFKAEVTDSEILSGLVLNEDTVKVNVGASPISNINFVQRLLGIKGRVKCITQPCDPSTSVIISPEEGDPINSALTTIPDPTSKGTIDQFVFKNIFPGIYKISINNENYCWDRDSFTVDSQNSDIENIEFVQSGYKLRVKSNIPLTLTVTQGELFNEEFKVNPSEINQFCLKYPGNYKIKTDDCYLFDEKLYQYSTFHPHILDYKVLKLKVRGTIRVKDEIEEAPTVLVQFETGENFVVQSEPLPSIQDIYSYEFWVTPYTSFSVTPQSEKLLFYPQKIESSISDEKCPEELPSIEGRKALFISGKVHPPIENVMFNITYVNEDGKEGIVETKISYDKRNGTYSIGPLYDNIEYTVKANAKGYHLKSLGDGNFSAEKLGSLKIKVYEIANGTKLVIPGVLLSLSRENHFRNNNLTDSNGEFLFEPLYPGTYYLMAFHKEFKFNNLENTFTINEGKDHSIEVIATRVAYSCYGLIESLNGKVESGITVEAVSNEGHTEEARSDSEGKYRIRGLLANTNYTIRIKNNLMNHMRIYSTPKTVSVKNEDIYNVNFIILNYEPKYEVYGYVNTNTSFLPFIKVQLYEDNDGKKGNLVKDIQLSEFINFYTFTTIPNKRYLVKVDTNLSRDIYSYDTDETLQSVVFVNGETAKRIDINFEPGYKQNIQDIPSTPLYTTLLIFLLVIGYYFRDNIIKKIK